MNANVIEALLKAATPYSVYTPKANEWPVVVALLEAGLIQSASQIRTGYWTATEAGRDYLSLDTQLWASGD